MRILAGETQGWISSLLGMGLVLLFLAILLFLWLAREISHSMQEVSRAAERLAQGDYTARLRALRPDLGQLARAMNHLAERVAGTVAELSHEKTQLSTILANMVEAVVAVDAQGSIIVLNAALCELFSIDPKDAKGKPFLEVLRQSEWVDMLQQVLSDRAPRIEEVRIFAPQERVFHCQAVPLFQGELCVGALLVLHDITQLRSLEQVRRDLVANVSHELRTPLAAIKGFTESLLSGALEEPENRLEFVQSIDREADHMARLTDDILDLAAIESGRRQLTFKPISLNKLAKSIAGELKPMADRRKVAIEILDSDIPTVRADPNQISQVFMNLIDNAVKFNREGGKVTVSFSREGDKISACIQDTGIGIPEVDLPRIFERFYRVDKSHSRELGGTGLGLAIVKHIVEAHSGSVSVQSIEGQGSKFYFSLPGA